MKVMHVRYSVFSFMMITLGLMGLGCSHSNSSNQGLVQSFNAPVIEPSWIRNGDPIVFEKNRWYPMDDTESLTDNEVYQIGEFQGTLIFVEKSDVRPFERLYTKFSRGRFRYYERMMND